MDSLSPTEVIDLEVTYNPTSYTGSNKQNPISVEDYSQRKDESSILRTKRFIDLSQEGDDDDDEVQVIIPTQPFRKKPFRNVSATETGHSTFVCEICVETKYIDETFHIKGCTHSYCSDCMVKYAASKIQENSIDIKCPEPNCVGELDPELCRSILPRGLFDRWSDALCESSFPESQNFYCPFKDCSALLIDDHEIIVKESECPHCRRMFCAQCKVPWHKGINCQEFQNLNEEERGREDLMLMQLAKDKKWQRCPRCNFFVEKSSGCDQMRCRCGYLFCYSCGAQNPHICPKLMAKWSAQTRNLEASRRIVQQRNNNQTRRRGISNNFQRRRVSENNFRWIQLDPGAKVSRALPTGYQTSNLQSYGS